MANIQPTRMRTVSDARNSFNALLGDAESGLTTHIVKGSKVVAHLVPATALMLDGAVDLLDEMLIRLAADAAAHSARHAWADGRLTNAGDFMGRLLAWTWTADTHVFTYALAHYHRALEHEVGQSISRESLVPGIETALGVTLGDSEIREIRTFLAGNLYWDDYYPRTSTTLSERNQRP